MATGLPDLFACCVGTLKPLSREKQGLVVNLKGYK